ncbi:CcdC protein domain-containing protein [Paenibacillus radicis (ex Gao et al. 2016)]|uniref:DUF1453 domain-containing protein n=1 Tax=Paenibacillus radicis (ex Gao et al. 2016) TaxID=1737354 RepID=A0A917GQW7_9BACL|nr:CcdC protein domain-containing protein [Paenibacillus radicis (ex Gao et al. 2016)]GGG54289.1 hypothetical protein GCM10010918_03890 [Paenibacillus radicis (ex Gao et al. 2016)]
MNMTSYIVILIIVVVLSLREREIRPSRLWIMPVIFTYMAFSNVKHLDLSFGSLLLYLLCLIIGLALGAWRGILQKVRVNPTTGKITSQGSIAGIIIFIAVLLVRVFAEYWGAHHSFLSFSTALLFVPLGSVIARRYFVYQKYRQLAAK